MPLLSFLSSAASDKSDLIYVVDLHEKLRGNQSHILATREPLLHTRDGCTHEHVLSATCLCCALHGMSFEPTTNPDHVPWGWELKKCIRSRSIGHFVFIPHASSVRDCPRNELNLLALGVLNTWPASKAKLITPPNPSYLTSVDPESHEHTTQGVSTVPPGTTCACVKMRLGNEHHSPNKYILDKRGSNSTAQQ